MRKGFVMAALVLIVPLIFCGCSGNDGATGATGAPGAPGDPGAPGTPGAPGGTAAVTQKHGAAVLAAEDLALSPPKYPVDVTITGATADASGVVTVDFTVIDDTTPVTTIASVNAGIFKLTPAGGGFSYNRWVSYLWRTETVSGTQDAEGNPFVKPDGYTVRQAYRERSGSEATNGTLVNHNDGSYTYTFGKNLAAATLPDNVTPVGYERNRLHRVSIYTGGHNGPTGEGDFDFVPDGSAGTGTRNIVQTATCRKCHGPEFHGHGGDRVTVEGCATCHSPDSHDAQSGESIELAVMVHKIHAGNELPIVAGPDGRYYDNPNTTDNEVLDNGRYILWGNSTNPASWEGAAFPAVLANCRSCHEGSGANVDNWKNVPSRAACGSCHDTIDWVTGANHSDGDRIMLNDDTCTDCHPATGTPTEGKSVTAAHAWTTADERNIPEFDIALSVNTPSRGYFGGGESPVITIVLTDKTTGLAIDHSDLWEDSSSTPGGGAEGCTSPPDPDGTVCNVPRDGYLTAASIYVTGPRAQRTPVLTYNARAKVTSASVGPWDLTALIETSRALTVKLDSGLPMLAFNDFWEYEGYGADELISGVVTVTLPAAVLTPDNVAALLNADTAFHERAVAYVENYPATGVVNRLSIRSRGLEQKGPGGEVVKRTAQPNVQIVASPAGMFAANAFGVAGSASQARKRVTTSSAGTDPKATFTASNITYTLDPVDDLVPGTYVVNVEFADRGRGPGNPSEPPYFNYKTPSVKVITFQVKQAAVEKPVAGGCTACHWSDGGVGFVLDFPRHNKLFNEQAVDQCGGCHDYNSNQNPGTDYYAATQSNVRGAAAYFGGGHPISKRVHAVHNGVNLAYPTLTVAHEETEAFGRNWAITYPMNVRNCESCHTAATSGSWIANPNRVACMGCHDSDEATAHMKAQTYDPTPLAPWSGDEQESCKACH